MDIFDNSTPKYLTADSIYDAVNAIKRAGWKSRKVNGEWEDVCCECQED